MKNRAELEDAMAKHHIDGMDLKTLVVFTYAFLTASYSDLSDAEFETMVREQAPHLLDEGGAV